MPNLPPHPMQPLVRDRDDIIRFRENKIVRYLLDNGPLDLNDIARLQLGREDEEQFAQLIGYSVRGFGELHYASDEAVEKADRMAEEMQGDGK